MHKKTLAGLTALFLVACGDKTSDSGDTGEWWDGEGSGEEGGDEDDEDEDDEGEDDEGEDDEDDEGDDDDDDDDGEESEEIGEFFWGELELEEGWGAVGVYRATSTGDLCELEYEVTAFASATSCTACDSAFELTIGTGETHEQEGTGCEGASYTDLEGTTLGVGYRGEALHLDMGSGFAEVPDGYAEVEGTEFFFEVGEVEDE